MALGTLAPTNNRDASESRFYFYDALDRLWKSTTLAGAALYTYTYDANGNRTQEIAPAGTTTTTYSAGTDRIAQASGAKAKHYAHDAYGSRIWAGPTAYAGLPSHAYNELNRLVEVRDPATQAVLGQYTYDAFGRRVRKLTASGTELFFYDAAGHLLEERSLATAPHTVRDYAWIEDEPVGTIDSGPQPTQFAWVHTDRLGTPLAVTSSPAAGNAATTWRASYEPFGLATVNEDADGDSQLYAMHLRFPGQRWDAESGGHYNFFRDYDPGLGRYQEFDPIGLAGGLNPMTYALGNPVGAYDPDGRSALVFRRSAGKLYVYPGNGSGSVAAGPPQAFGASNNAVAGANPSLPNANGPLPNGTYSTGPMLPTPYAASSGFGNSGFIPINLNGFYPNGSPAFGPSRTGTGIHAGRVGVCDRAGRCNENHATHGCLRTTPSAMSVLASDPPAQITVAP